MKTALTSTAQKWTSAKTVMYNPSWCNAAFTSIRSEWETNISSEESMARSTSATAFSWQPPSLNPAAYNPTPDRKTNEASSRRWSTNHFFNGRTVRMQKTAAAIAARNEAVMPQSFSKHA